MSCSASRPGVLPLDGPSLGVALTRPGSDVVVDFCAPGCVECRSLAPSIERLAGEHPDVTVVALDLERSPRSADRYGIEQLPTVIRFRCAEPVAIAVGALPYDVLVERLGLLPPRRRHRLSARRPPA